MNFIEVGEFPAVSVPFYCSNFELRGIPVLFIPGNAGSHKQGTL